MIGFLAALLGGVQVKADAEGAWVRVGLLHAAGGTLVVVGLLATLAAGSFRTKGEDGSAASDPQETEHVGSTHFA